MAFAFIHTADWQIGKAFGRFEADKAAILRRARFDVIDRIAAAARSANAAHVLVAGDVFDGETLPDSLVQQTLARLAAHGGAQGSAQGGSTQGTAGCLTWHLLPGNHDPARPGGIWERMRRSGVPVCVVLHLDAMPTEISPDVYLLPAPLTAKAMSHDPTAWMDAAVTPPHALRIGLAHGSIKGFGSLGEAAVPIDPARPKYAGLAYMALGDWHGTKSIGPALWYSGTPEPDSFAENDPGNVLAIRLAGPGSPAEVATVPSGQFTWANRRVMLAGAHDVAALETDILRQGPGAATYLLNLTLEGRIPLSATPEIELRLSRLRALLFDLRIDRTRLMATATDADLLDLGDDALAAVAVRLKARADAAIGTTATGSTALGSTLTGTSTSTSTGSEQQAAMRALERLVALAASANVERHQ